jgi:Uma2 family endonuclease
MARRGSAIRFEGERRPTMESAAARHPMTVEEYHRLPDHDRFREGLVRGRLVREPWPAPLHGRLQVRLAHLLNAHVEARQAPRLSRRRRPGSLDR